MLSHFETFAGDAGVSVIDIDRRGEAAKVAWGGRRRARGDGARARVKQGDWLIYKKEAMLRRICSRNMPSAVRPRSKRSNGPSACRRPTIGDGAALLLLLTVADKRALKPMSAYREITIAAIIHEWVCQNLEEGWEDEQGISEGPIPPWAASCGRATWRGVT